MFTRIAWIAVSAVTVGLGASLTGSASAKPPGRVATCAAIQKETRAFVAAAVKAGGVSVSAERVMAAIAPLGTCVEPVVGGGQWALVLTGPPEIMLENIIMPEDYDANPDSDEEPTGRPSAWTMVRDWKPVFVTGEGRRVIPEETPPLPGYDAYLDDEGYAMVTPYRREDQSVEPVIKVGANGDGSFSAAFGNAGLFWALVRFDGKAVVVDPAQTIFETLSQVTDLNNDGISDLVDRDTVSVREYGDGNRAHGLNLIALGRPDGSFTTDHPFIVETYRKECEGLGRSPWALARPSSSTVVANVACARLFGVPVATIKAGLEAENATVTENDDDTTIPAISIFRESFDELMVWLDVGLPRYDARSDGMRVVPVAAAKSVAEMKAFGVYRFDAAQMIDGDLGTSWQPKKARDAWLEFKLSAVEPVAALEIANGFQRFDKLGDLFAMNSRVARIAVTAGGKTFELAVDAGARGFQRIDLPEVVATDTIRVVVKGTAKGARWDHLAISEVRVLAR